jgi:hypothetical protein
VSDSPEQKKPSFDEIVRNHAAVWLLGTAIAAATAGFGAYPALISIAGRTTNENQRLSELENAAQGRKVVARQVDVLKSDLDKVTSGMNKLSGLLETGFWLYREIDLRRQVRKSFEIGDCPGEKCYKFTIDVMNNSDTAPNCAFQFTRNWIL